MLGQRRAEELLWRVLGFSKADETEVLILAHDSYLTRFANNSIHQNVAETNATVTVKAVAGKSLGMASTNDLSERALAQTAECALVHARQRPADPDFPGLPDPQPLQPAQAFDDDTAGLTPESRARAAGAICTLARGQGLRAAGAFRTAAQEVAIANSHGLLAYHPNTVADLQLVVAGDDGSGWAQGSGWRARDVAAEALGHEAVAKALRAQNPRPIEPGEYTVVLDPYVTDELLTTLSYFGMGAQAIEEGHSWMSDRIGKREMSPLVSIWDDGRDSTGAPQPFDGEGMPRRRVQIVERGVICGPVYDRYTAGKAGRETTGHAMPPGPLAGAGQMALNLFMAGGDSSLEQMIASTPKGLYITRFWYPHLVHSRDCVISAMTRDGVYLIENGELAYPVKNLRFTQSYVTALAHVQAIGQELRTLIGNFGTTTRVPALKIEHFTFTGTTI